MVTFEFFKYPSKASFEIFGTLYQVHPVIQQMFCYTVGYHYLKPCHNYFNKNYNYNSNIVVTIVTITCAQLTKPTRKTAKCRIKL